MIPFGKQILSAINDVRKAPLFNRAEESLITKASEIAAHSRSQRIASGIKAKAASTGKTVAGSIDSANITKTANFLNKKSVKRGLIGGAAVYGFSSGLDNNRQISNSFYNLTTGSPDFDQYALGTSVSPRGLMMPLPGERMFRQSTIQPGTWAGGLAGGLAGLKLKGLKGGMIGAAAGAVAGQSLFAGATGLDRNAILTQRTYQDAWRANRKSRNQYVDGSMAFGMYNARLG